MLKVLEKLSKLVCQAKIALEVPDVFGRWEVFKSLHLDWIRLVAVLVHDEPGKLDRLADDIGSQQRDPIS